LLFVIKKKYFTLEEARKLLPEVKDLLEELIHIQVKLELSKQVDISYDDLFKDEYNHVIEGLRYHTLHTEFFSVLHDLMKKGAFVKDTASGLVDFHSKFQGKEIFLCYQYPEDDIAFWHGAGEGFTGRKPVEMLEKEQEL